MFCFQNTICVVTTHHLFHIIRHDYLIYLVIGVFFSYLSILSLQKGYSDQFGSYESTRNLEIYSMGINAIISRYEQLLVYLMNNPFVYSIVKLVASFFGYIGNGIKAGVLISGLTLILSYQFFVKKMTALRLTLRNALLEHSRYIAHQHHNFK